MAGLLFRKTFLDVVIVNEEVKKRSKSAPAAMSLGNLLKLPVLRLIELVSILKCVFFVLNMYHIGGPHPFCQCSEILRNRKQKPYLQASRSRSQDKYVQNSEFVGKCGAMVTGTQHRCFTLKISASQMLTPRAIYSLLVPSEVANLEKRSELLKSNPDAEKVHITHSSMPTSKGSVGHPEVCRRPCIQFLRGHCDRGALCGYCHLTHVPRL